MEESFFDKVHKHDVHTPDVLSCLANLSNDEVFTPPNLVNKVLDALPQELFSNPDIKFLDPACKTGVFLREIAKRLLVGLEPVYPNLQERIDHIFHKQLFGIAITELTSLLSRRSLYCSKYPNGKYSISSFDSAEGNIFFKKMPHLWQKGKCLLCGAAQSQYDRGDKFETYAYNFIHCSEEYNKELFKWLKDMKFDVIIGNPPYQLSDGGGTGDSATPLYHLFVQQAKRLNPRYITMIIPARWYAGGKGLEEFRNEMLSSRHIKYLVDFSNSADCFPGVTIAGGICYFLWQRDFCGDCKISNVVQNQITSVETRPLNEYPFFVRSNQAIGIIRKIKNKREEDMSSMVHSRNCFKIYSNEIGHSTYTKGDFILYSLKGRSYISAKKIVDRDRIADKYKVIITKAMSGGNKPSSEGNYLIISSLKVISPKEVCTETYLCVGDFNNKEEALNLKSYISTSFFRFLLLQALTSINISKDKFIFVPLQDFTQEWTDEKLYAKYGLSQDEIAFIESMIKPMEDK